MEEELTPVTYIDTPRRRAFWQFRAKARIPGTVEHQMVKEREYNKNLEKSLKSQAAHPAVSTKQMGQVIHVDFVNKKKLT